MVKTIEDMERFMELVYEMNPDKTPDEIDDVIHKGMKRKAAE